MMIIKLILIHKIMMIIKPTKTMMTVKQTKTMIIKLIKITLVNIIVKLIKTILIHKKNQKKDIQNQNMIQKNPPDLNVDHVDKSELPKAKIQLPKSISVAGAAFTKHIGQVDIRELPKKPPKQYIGLPATELVRQRPIPKLTKPFAARRSIKIKKIKPAPKQYTKTIKAIESLKTTPISNIPVETLTPHMTTIIERLKNLDLAMSMDEHNEVFGFIKKIENHNQLNKA
eukprot:211126_1